MLHTTIFFTLLRKHPRLMLQVSKCIKTAVARKFLQIMNPHPGCLIKFLPNIRLRNLQRFLLKIAFFGFSVTSLSGFRVAPSVPVVPKVSKVSSVQSFASFTRAPKAPFAPKARFAPRAPSTKFPPRVKRPKLPTRPKPTRLVPFVKRAPVVPRPKPVRVVPQRLF